MHTMNIRDSIPVLLLVCDHIYKTKVTAVREKCPWGFRELTTTYHIEEIKFVLEKSHPRGFKEII